MHMCSLPPPPPLHSCHDHDPAASTLTLPRFYALACCFSGGLTERPQLPKGFTFRDNPPGQKVFGCVCYKQPVKHTEAGVPKPDPQQTSFWDKASEAEAVAWAERLGREHAAAVEEWTAQQASTTHVPG